MSGAGGGECGVKAGNRADPTDQERGAAKPFPENETLEDYREEKN